MKIEKPYGVVDIATGISIPLSTTVPPPTPGGSPTTKNTYLFASQGEAEEVAQTKVREQPSKTIGVTVVVAQFQVPVTRSPVD